MSLMRSILDTLTFLLLFPYYCLEAFVLMFIGTQTKKKMAGQIVLVTGSANGIGRQIALNFARLGAVLVLWDIDEEGNEKTTELVRANGAQAVHTYKCDLRKKEEIYAVADQVKKEVGDVNILVNNAGILNKKSFRDLSDSEIEETLKVNTKAHFWTCKAFLPAMITRNRGHLVTIASVAAFFGSNGTTDYSASKYAAFGFLESLTLELRKEGKNGIKTTIVCPSYVNTRLIAGVKIKPTFLLPLLDVTSVGRKIVDAVLKEKLYVVLPPQARLLILKIFLPKKAVFLLADYLGF
uniref:Short-chain dehydrogenase/reductase family 16C member 6-like n=1 Tax=Pogona vitticeps TaxID=103695 RepID=A0ABM5GBL4_9SAUR